MFTIALVGGDGAGKTTIANAVIRSSSLPMKYLYMGLSTRSSNYALPTSRLVLFIKQQMHERRLGQSAQRRGHEMTANELEYAPHRHGFLWNLARFLNRLAEASYRQLISINYQIQGNVVIYDRHFFFDAAPDVIRAENQSLAWFDQLFFWLMTHLYPRPTLTIFLDAPAHVLYGRKGEATPQYLEQQRQAFLDQGKRLTHFVQVDASQPKDKVIRIVAQQIDTFSAAWKAKHANFPSGGQKEEEARQ